LGVGNLLVLPILYGLRSREAGSYTDASVCGALCRDDCRFRTDASVVATDCGHANFCELPFRFAGAFGSAEAVFNLSPGEADLLRAAGGRAQVEVFRGVVTRVEVDGRLIGPERGPAGAARYILHLVVLAAAMAAVGGIGLARWRRRSRR